MDKEEIFLLVAALTLDIMSAVTSPACLTVKAVFSVFGDLTNQQMKM